MTALSPWHNDQYVEHLKRFTAWEYSHRNARYFRKSLGMDNVAEVRLGYVPEMTRLNRDFPLDIDVLFYGAVNERRKAVLETLRRTKLRLGILQRTYGTDRDYSIARSKLVLNVHYYVPATLAVPRLGYLWANHTPRFRSCGGKRNAIPAWKTAAASAPMTSFCPRSWNCPFPTPPEKSRPKRPLPLSAACAGGFSGSRGRTANPCRHTPTAGLAARRLGQGFPPRLPERGHQSGHERGPDARSFPTS